MIAYCCWLLTKTSVMSPTCAVLHGLGGNFCAGYDLEELSELEDDISNKIAEIIMDQVTL